MTIPTTFDERTARRVVIVSAIAVFIIFGIRLSFSVFFAEFVAAEGWSSESAAGIYSMSMLAFAIGSAPGGILLDRFGPRVVFSGGALLLAVGLFLSSQAQSVEGLTIAYGVVGGMGLSVIGLGQVAAVIAGWVPPAGRGRAIGVAFAGSGLGSLLFVPLCVQLINHFGWRGAYGLLALLCVLVLVPLMVFGQRKPPVVSRPAPRPPDTRSPRAALFRRPAFWAMMLVSFTAIGPLRTLSVHQIAYIESNNIARETAANYVGLEGFLTAFTFIGWGFVSDRLGRTWTFVLGAMCMLVAVGALVLLQSSGSALLLIVYSVGLALGEGTRSSQPTAVASDIFQESGLGLVNGMVGAMFGLGAAFAPWLVGRLRDQTGSYMPGLATVAVLVLISIAGFIAVVYFDRRRKRPLQAQPAA